MTWRILFCHVPRHFTETQLTIENPKDETTSREQEIGIMHYFVLYFGTISNWLLIQHFYFVLYLLEKSDPLFLNYASLFRLYNMVNKTKSKYI